MRSAELSHQELRYILMRITDPRWMDYLCFISTVYIVEGGCLNEDFKGACGMNRDNTRLLYSVIAVSLMSVIVLQAAAGCMRKSPRKIDTVPEDAPWFTSTTVTYGAFSEEEYLYPILIEPDHKVYLHDFYDESGEYRSSLEIFGDAGEQESVPVPFDREVTACFSVEDSIYAVASYSNANKCENILCKYDPGIKEMTDVGEIVIEGNHPDAVVRQVICKNDLLFIYYDYLVESIYHSGFEVLANDYSNLYQFDMDGELIKWSVTNEGKIIAFTEIQGGLHINEIDYQTSAVSEIELPNEILNKYSYGSFMNDGRIYSQNADLTLSCYDFNTNEEYIALDYNYCDANICQLCDYTLFYADGEVFLYVKSAFYSGESTTDNTVLELDLEGSNPNAGEQILYVAPSGSIDPFEGEGIINFNRSNDEYYLKVTMDYSSSSITRPEYITDIEDIRGFEYNSQITRLDALRNDIINGTGPDIIIDFGEYPVLNSSSYLMDLTSVSESLSDKEYFVNLINAFKNGNSIYQMPMSACVSGIYMSNDIVSSATDVLTPELYESLISDSLNGKDPVGDYYGRDLYLQLLLKYNYYSTHDEKGFLRIDSEEFKDIASLVKNTPAMGTDDSVKQAKYVYCSQFAYNLTQMILKSDGYVLTGFPSENYFGPMAECRNSVAVTSCSVCPEVGFEFIRGMLSYDVQSKCISYNPINVNAFEDFAQVGLEYANAFIESNYGYEDYYSDSIISSYEELLRSAQVGGMSDPVAMLIINEDMQAYYADQKSIDEVIPIIENRVNNMIEEKS